MVITTKHFTKDNYMNCLRLRPLGQNSLSNPFTLIIKTASDNDVNPKV